MGPSRYADACAGLARVALAAAVALTLATLALAAGPDPLTGYRERLRLLVLSAPRADDPALAAQRSLLAAAKTGLRERDLVVVILTGEAAKAQDCAALHAAALDAGAVRRAVGLDPKRFGAALVGRDGGVKLRRERPIGSAELFGAVDAMPMRRDEMRRR